MQFDWVGRLLKNTEGSQRLSQISSDTYLKSVITNGSLTVRPTSQAGTKVGYNEQLTLCGKVSSKGT